MAGHFSLLARMVKRWENTGKHASVTRGRKLVLTRSSLWDSTHETMVIVFGRCCCRRVRTLHLSDACERADRPCCINGSVTEPRPADFVCGRSNAGQTWPPDALLPEVHSR